MIAATAAGNDQLTASGLKPTQTKQQFDRYRIQKMVDALQDGTFDWKTESLQPVIMGPDGEDLMGFES